MVTSLIRRRLLELLVPSGVYGLESEPHVDRYSIVPSMDSLEALSVENFYENTQAKN